MATRRSSKTQKRSLMRPATAPEKPTSTEPNAQLLFSGLHFYFFPNSRTNRARALRIDKAIQHGATFCQNWSSKVTHLILDDGMLYEQFSKYHPDIKSLPDQVVVVNGRYVADCISYGTILAPGQRVYQVLGHTASTSEIHKLKRTTSEPALATTIAKPSEIPLQPPSTSAVEFGLISKPFESQEYNSIVDTIGRSVNKQQPSAEAISYSAADKNANRGAPQVPNSTATYDDDLSAMINETKATAHLPIEAGEDETTPTTSPTGETSYDLPTAATGKSSIARSVQATIDHNSIIMQRPSDGHWVKLRCKECGDTNFHEIKDFLGHCAFLHRQRFKTQDDAVEECGFPLQSYSPTIDTDAPSEQATASPEQEGDTEPVEGSKDTETQSPPAKRVKTAWQEQFACMNKHDKSAKGKNPNADILDQLQEMADFYERTGDRWRSLSFRRGIATLRKQSKRIATKEEALKLPSVGDSIAEAIEKIVQTGKLSRLEATKDDPLNQILQLFMGIYGVGLSQATRWVSAGYRTLDDIRSNAQLSQNQKIGLEHYKDLQQRIPRTEVEAHGNVFKKAIAEIDSAFQVTIGGSYRRGSSNSGDIDLIITKPDANLHQIRSAVHEQVVPKLFAKGFLKAELARMSVDSGSKWHGCSAINDGPWRRIDFLLVPWDEMGAALIYFTGNDIFNRSIRLLASRKGMRLNQHGLYKDVLRGKQREKFTEGELLESKSEEKIFGILGVPWRPPEHRNC